MNANAVELQDEIARELHNSSALQLLGNRLLQQAKSTDRLKYYQPYPKQTEFHTAGATSRERLLAAANQSGKTLCASFEAAMHATGRYPDGWQGRRFERPTIGLVTGQSWQLVRDNVQRLLLGTTDIKQRDQLGTGAIPRDALILDSLISAPVQGAAAQCRVRHIDGGISVIHVVPYLAGRVAVQSYTADWAWCDEEPPESFYLELLTRTNVELGPVFITFTPLLGMSAVVLRFFEPDVLDEGAKNRALIQMTLEDALHYSPEQRTQIEASYPPHERDARCRGIPKLGSGAIYPIPREAFEVAPFELPKHWPRVYGMDVGWNRTAAIWGALDRETDTLYLYHEYYVGAEKPAVHAAAIKAPGDWIPGVIDPASQGRTQTDGTKLIDDYRKAGLQLMPADHTLESGLYRCWDRLTTGRLKVFSTLRNWFSEHATYRRGDDGKVVKERDHLMDACICGETKVITTEGAIPIAALVGKTGWVISRDGSVCWFLGARKTLENVPIVKVTFEDGSSVKCTPDHPFLTIDGWVEAKDLVGYQCYNGVYQRIQARILCKSILSLQPFKSLTASVTSFAGAIFSVMENGFIGLFGNLPISNPSQRAISFITLTTIGQTIIPPIWRWSIVPRMQNITGYSSSLDSQPRKLWKPPPDGTDQKQGKPWPRRFMRGHKSLTIPCGPINVPVASAFLKPLSTIIKKIFITALKRVKRKVVAVQGLMIFNGIAWSVARFLRSIVTVTQCAVQENVAQRCESVKEAGRADVYCLTVPATHSFCIESGVVVHNTRYLVMSGLTLARSSVSTSRESTKPRSWKTA